MVRRLADCSHSFAVGATGTIGDALTDITQPVPANQAIRNIHYGLDAPSLAIGANKELITQGVPRQRLIPDAHRVKRATPAMTTGDSANLKWGLRRLQILGGRPACDELAVEAAQGFDLADDTGYLSDPSSSGLGKAPGHHNAAHTNAVRTKPVHTNKEHTSGEFEEPKQGGACRKCSESLIKKPTKSKARKPGQTYYYEWYLFCPGCSTMYMVNEAKRVIQ